MPMPPIEWNAAEMQGPSRRTGAAHIVRRIPRGRLRDGNNLERLEAFLDPDISRSPRVPSPESRVPMIERDLIHDWNVEADDFDWTACRVELNDETLRDGLQCPSVTDPVIEDKKALLHLMVQLGIASADIGL